MDTLYTPCHYRVEGVFCWDGYLHYAQRMSAELREQYGLDGPPFEPVMVGGQQVSCPMCNGLGFLPTNEGKDVLKFLEVFARPVLQKMIEEILQEHR